jgi:two-component system, cell cycle response regulator DivK
MPRRVLLIEDNEQNRYLVTYLLEAAGFRVLAAATGDAGIALACAAAPDLILLDIQLPGMDGYAVAGALRREPATRFIPIVAVTSYAMAGDRERTLAAGCDGYLEKPIDPDTFAGTVAGFIRATNKGDTA